VGLRDRCIKLATDALDLAAEVGERECSDTMPCPPPDVPMQSDRVAEECGWIESPGEPDWEEILRPPPPVSW
jgi:hypothetical protein